MKTDRIGKGSLLALALMALLSVAAVTVPSTSWFRVAGNNAGVGLYLQCTNADGSAQWAEVPARFSFITVTNIATVSNLSIRGCDANWELFNDFNAHGLGCDTLLITNAAIAGGAWAIGQFGNFSFGPLSIFGGLNVQGAAFLTNNLTVSGNITNNGHFMNGQWLGGYATFTDTDQILRESAVTEIELGHVGGVTGPIQPQLDGKVAELAGVGTNLTIQGLTIGTNLVYSYTAETVPTNTSGTVNSNLQINVSPVSGRGTRELYVTNGVAFTNFTGYAAGTQASAHWLVTPSGNQTAVWPSAGANFGIFRLTNSAAPLWTTLTNGVRYRVVFEFWDTNGFFTIAAYQ